VPLTRKLRRVAAVIKSTVRATREAGVDDSGDRRQAFTRIGSFVAAPPPWRQSPGTVLTLDDELKNPEAIRQLESGSTSPIRFQPFSARTTFLLSIASVAANTFRL
jgi:hypothetical protein